MDLEAFAEQLEAGRGSELLRSEYWIVPLLQSIHILGVCFVLTSFILIFARSWKIAGTEWSSSQWAERLSPFLVYGFLALLFTGILQAWAEPTREIPNWLFQLKLVLIVVALPFAIVLVKMFRNDQTEGLALKALSGLLALVILILIFVGRWIAYI